MNYVETKSLVGKILTVMKGLLSLGEVFLSLPLLWTTIHEVLEYFHCKSQDPGHL